VRQLTPETLAELRELEKRATPGPWKGAPLDKYSLDLCAAMRNALPGLLDAAEDSEKWKNLLRGQMAVTGQVLEENTQRMATELVLADENAELQEAIDFFDSKAIEQKLRCEALQQELTEGDYWMKRSIEFQENGGCPVCFGDDEGGHEDGCEWGRCETAGDEADIANRLLYEENISLRKEIACVNRQTYDSGRTLLGLENYQLQINLAASRKREKWLTNKIRQADYRFETWIKQPAWACEEYNQFCKAWEAVMQTLKEGEHL
jgi:hypothetical protein